MIIAVHLLIYGIFMQNSSPLFAELFFYYYSFKTCWKISTWSKKKPTMAMEEEKFVIVKVKCVLMFEGNRFVNGKR